MPNYSYSKQLNLPFNEVVDKTITAFKAKGFGVLTDVDAKHTFKEKLSVNFKNYRILGMCNPPRAYQALHSEEEMGLFLPCNVIIYDHDDGMVVVSAIRPTVAFDMINNSDIVKIAMEMENILKEVIDNLS